MDRDPFDLLGGTLDGQYRVVALAGRGDLSVVYRGRHLAADALVAIKCLDLPPTLDGALVRPLVESFREASRLHALLARGNRNIAQSFGSGSILAPATGMIVPYLVREWFEGESLAANLARRRAGGEKGRSLEEAVALLQPAVEAVSYAHAQALPHLALNPSNLFLADRGGKRTLRVLDFGVARAMNDLAQAIPAASRPPGLRAIFPAYAAPEQIDATAGKTGPWTDVYALAVVLMELLSDRPVEAGGKELLSDRAVEAGGKDLPGYLDRALTRALSRAPERRQKDVRELWQDVTLPVGGSTARPPVATLRPAGMGAVPPAPPLVAFEALAPQASVHLVTTPLPPQAATPALPPVMVAEDSPPAPPALPPGPSAASRLPVPTSPAAQSPTFPVLEQPPPSKRSGRVVASVLAAVIGSSLGMGLVVLLRRQLATSVPAPPPAPVFPAASVPAASALPATSASASAPDPESPRPALPLVPRFPAAAARQALDAASHELARCKLGKVWGTATANVTFGNDGAVSQVAVSVPFTGTATGRCVAEALETARVPPFAGKPGLLGYRFFVPPK